MKQGELTATQPEPDHERLTLLELDDIQLETLVGDMVQSFAAGTTANDFTCTDRCCGKTH